MRIRVADTADAQELLAIYAPYVEETAISFEYDVPTEKEFEKRIQTTLEKYPYLVAEHNNELLGYAYTGPFVGRAAYGWSAETTIYVKKGCTGQGAGRALYEALERVSGAQNILNLNACIGYPETEDEYLTENSVKFHRHMGYRMVGLFHNSGYKFGRWYHMVWMEKLIGKHAKSPEPIIPFSQMDRRRLEALDIYCR